jgi:hypothetical protein
MLSLSKPIRQIGNDMVLRRLQAGVTLPRILSLDGCLRFCGDGVPHLLAVLYFLLTFPLAFSRVGGDAPTEAGAGLRPPLKLHEQVYRMQLSERVSLKENVPEGGVVKG